MTCVYFLTVVFSLYVIGDYATTVSVIAVSPIGVQSEINPVSAFTYSAMGEPGLLLLKLSTFAAIAFVSIRTARDPNRRKFVKYTLGGLAIYSLIVVGINIYTLSSILSL